MSKKLEIRGWETALQGIPEADRFTVAAEIRRIFEEAQALGVTPGKPVLELPFGSTSCPKCGAVLEFQFDVIPSEPCPEGLRIFECGPCDQCYNIKKGDPS